MKICKNLMKKSYVDGKDQYQALLEQHNTPRQDCGQSPTQMMFGWQTRSLIPSLKYGPTIQRQDFHSKRSARRRAVEKYYNKKARNMSELHYDQHVYFQQTGDGEWRRARVREKHNDRSYILESDDTGNYRRNRVHIRPAPQLEVNWRALV